MKPPDQRVLASTTRRFFTLRLRSVSVSLRLGWRRHLRLARWRSAPGRRRPRPPVWPGRCGRCWWPARRVSSSFVSSPVACLSQRLVCRHLVELAVDAVEQALNLGHRRAARFGHQLVVHAAGGVGEIRPPRAAGCRGAAPPGSPPCAPGPGRPPRGLRAAGGSATSSSTAVRSCSQLCFWLV